MDLSTPVTQFPGVGPARAEKLEKLGLRTAGDLIAAYPRGYEDRRAVYTVRDAPLGEKVCIRAMAAGHPRLSRVRRGMELVQLRAVDATGALHVTFFNQSYMERALSAGEEYIFFGAVEEQGRRRTMANPIVEQAGRQEHTGRIMPVYRLTAGISNHLLASLTRLALEGCAHLLPETLPRAVREAYGLARTESAHRSIHFPDSPEALDQARRRLSFEELFYLSVGLDRLKSRRSAGRQGAAVPARPPDQFAALLPFPLTGAQRRTMEEIARDLSSGKTMNRLVQGDVGSGKTMAAAYAVWLAALAGWQCALMAPTEVLARQHFATLSPLMARAGIETVLLTGSLTAAEKRSARERLALGGAVLAVGTHALLSQGVEFARLGLVVTDEQHRFGVGQRSALAAKAEAGSAPPPHVLVMSATPIPRTLALIIYGDLDVSVIDQLPPGRTPVETYVVGEDKRQRMYNFVRRLAGEGRQAYIICPAVEEGDGEAWAGAPDLKAVKVYARQLQEQVFPDLRVDFLHGKMRPREKERVMAAFAGGESDVLVSTTVIEVGVDVPNAALIIIENAERFGLSQLHQLRGRVGRGTHRSYCVLMAAGRGETARQRLRTLARTRDGFAIAEEDLKLRGPGDFFGRRQHGLPALRAADLAGDMRVLQQARQAAREVLEQDPELERPENRAVRDRVRQMFSETPDIFN
ncbi:MAG: ATP-dependent DNA helicase RecG [Lawsonibacter sp.]|nr:ATP-dependent DNA helicase RecG [Lawsonibacter sp.]